MTAKYGIVLLLDSEGQAEKLHLLQEIMDQSLLLAEVTLRHPKYRKMVRNSGNILAEFLNLMEKAQRVESQVIIVQLLVRVGVAYARCCFRRR